MPAYTPNDIVDNFNDYADYEELGSVARAKSFITWAMRMLGGGEHSRHPFDAAAKR